MKKIFVLALSFTLVLGIFSCRKKGEQPAEVKIDAALLKDSTKIEFLDSVEYKFDTITQGDKESCLIFVQNPPASQYFIGVCEGK